MRGTHLILSKFECLSDFHAVVWDVLQSTTENSFFLLNKASLFLFTSPLENPVLVDTIPSFFFREKNFLTQFGTFSQCEDEGEKRFGF